MYYDKKLYIKEMPEPDIDDSNDVKIKVSLAGICGTDLTLVNEGNDLGHVIGHEAIGTIVAIGDSVKTLNIGDWVIVNPNEHCGICDNCRKGLYYLCSGNEGDLAIAGLNKHGTFSEYFITKENFVEIIPSNISTEQRETFLLVEPLACVLQGLEKLDTSELKKILVIGQGTMGYLATKTLLKSGHQVYSVDSNEEKVAMLSKTMPCCFNSLEAIEGEFDIIIDTVGNQFELGYPFLKRNGEFLILGLQHRHKVTVNTTALVQKNQKILGSSEYTTHFYDAKKYLEAHLDIQEEVFLKYNLIDFNQAFFEKSSCIKRVFVFSN
ncbi:zinc-binding dehydrogenase [Enterococcus rivorum]|uniref:zinc-dependent alcohol dehydrogenase n=1 Tax=Enterococcus rivorum TaxID=762845 RepID=UPI0014709BAE